MFSSPTPWSSNDFGCPAVRRSLRCSSATNRWTPRSANSGVSRSPFKHIAFQSVEYAAASVLDRRGGGNRRRGAQYQYLAQARTGRSLLCHRADFLLHGLGIAVAFFQLGVDLRRNPALRSIGFDIFDHLHFGLTETLDQLAGFVRGRMALAGRFDQLAALL